MILFYVDESGTGFGTKQPFFSLGTIAIAAQDWARIDREFILLKRRLISWAKPEDWEIKGRDLRQGANFFKKYHWEQRLTIFKQIAELVSELPCQLFAVQIDKRALPETISNDTDLYRLAFWRLLETLNTFLQQANEDGMIMADMRSTLHDSVQDRRLLDAYREWVELQSGRSRFIELPWFGFSAFYTGLQLADFVSYLMYFISSELERGSLTPELQTIFDQLKPKIQLIQIP